MSSSRWGRVPTGGGRSASGRRAGCPTSSSRSPRNRPTPRTPATSSRSTRVWASANTSSSTRTASSTARPLMGYRLVPRPVRPAAARRGRGPAEPTARPLARGAGERAASDRPGDAGDGPDPARTDRADRRETRAGRGGTRPGPTSSERSGCRDSGPSGRRGGPRSASANSRTSYAGCGGRRRGDSPPRRAEWEGSAPSRPLDSPPVRSRPGRPDSLSWRGPPPVPHPMRPHEQPRIECVAGIGHAGAARRTRATGPRTPLGAVARPRRLAAPRRLLALLLPDRRPRLPRVGRLPRRLGRRTARRLADLPAERRPPVGRRAAAPVPLRRPRLGRLLPAGVQPRLDEHPARQRDVRVVPRDGVAGVVRASW